MAKVVFLTQGTTTWTVPTDFGSLVSVECIGAGSSGNASGTGANQSGGGGGAYAKIVTTTTPLAPGLVINVGIGAGGAGVTTGTSNAGGNTWWNATSLNDAVTNTSAKSCAAQGGQPATTSVGGPGGSAASSVGTTTHSGGTGSHAATGGAGGGAAGKNGDGNSTTTTTGGQGDFTFGGLGGTSNNPGSPGTEYDPTHGSGGGAGRRTTTGVGFAGGLYGAGGGESISTGNASGAGANGLLIITYNQLPINNAISFPVFPLVPFLFDWQYSPNLSINQIFPSVIQVSAVPPLGHLYADHSWDDFTLNYPAPLTLPMVRMPNRTRIPFSGTPYHLYNIFYKVPAGQDNLPKNQYNWPVPKGPAYPDQTFYQYIIPVPLNIVGKPRSLPNRFELPALGYNPKYQAYIIPAGQDLLPFNQHSWPVPQGPGYQDQTVYQYIIPVPLTIDTQLRNSNRYVSRDQPFTPYGVSYIIPAGEDQIPANQYNWPNPTLPTPTGKDWISYTFIPRYPAAVVNFPKVSQVYFVPAGPPPNQDWRNWYNLNLISKDFIPGKAYLTLPTPLPGRVPADWVNFLTHIPPHPKPPAQTIGGRVVTIEEVEEDTIHAKPWREGIKRLDVSIAAQALGRKGGIASGKARR